MHERAVAVGCWQGLCRILLMLGGGKRESDDETLILVLHFLFILPLLQRTKQFQNAIRIKSDFKAVFL